jgi:parvulin-like peptidyl-prolyl isomerase
MKRTLLPMLALCGALAAQTHDPNAVIGKIQDQEYKFAEYNEILERYYAYYSNGKELSTEEKAKLNDQCYEELIGRYIYDQAIAAGKIKLTDSELLAEAKKNPPAGTTELKDLQTNGRFDPKRYEQALANFPDFRAAVLDAVREMYQYTKLLATIRAEADVDPDSVKAQWLKENDSVDAQIIFFDYTKLTHITPTEEEVQLYYDEHKQSDYRRENGRQLFYVQFPKLPSQADTLAARDKVADIYRQLLEGGDFAALAREHSQDTGSALNGGDLGFFGRGRMVPEFEEAAFTTPVGQISEPIQTRYGWHIIQPLERRTSVQGEEEVSARHILIMVNPGEATQQKLKIDSNALYSLARETGLAEAARRLGWKLQQTPPFQENDGFIRQIGRDPKLISFAFANPVGTLSEPVYAPSGDVFICEVSAVLPEWFIPFDEEKVSITNRATRVKRMYYMNEYAKSFAANIPPDQYLDYAERDSLAVIEVNGQLEDGSITPVGKIDALNRALFSTPEGSFSELIADNNRWFLVKVLKRNRPDPAVWTRDQQQIIAKAREKAQQDHLNEWYFNERKKISIIDNRADYYDLSSVRKQIRL